MPLKAIGPDCSGPPGDSPAGAAPGTMISVALPPLTVNRLAASLLSNPAKNG